MSEWKWRNFAITKVIWKAFQYDEVEKLLINAKLFSLGFSKFVKSVTSQGCAVELKHYKSMTSLLGVVKFSSKFSFLTDRRLIIDTNCRLAKLRFKLVLYLKIPPRIMASISPHNFSDIKDLKRRIEKSTVTLGPSHIQAILSIHCLTPA